jgi:hypothetical protein
MRPTSSHRRCGSTWTSTPYGGARRGAAADLRSYGEAMAALPDSCPFTLDELLNREVEAEAEAYAAKLAALAAAATPS